MSDDTPGPPITADRENDQASREESLRAAEQAIADHPGFREYSACRALEECINSVFIPNLREVLALLEQASSNEELAFELIQNVREPIVRERFQALAIQRLHNYLASAMTLVDHVRRLMKGRTDRTADEFKRRKSEMLKNPEVPFIQDLRNFTLHRTLPILGHRVSMTNVNKPDQAMESEVEISVQALLTWNKWSPASRGFLATQGETIKLRPVIRRHGELVIGLNTWLHNELAAAIDLDAINEFVLRRNMILVGGDRETANRLTNERTMRTMPQSDPATPPSSS